MKNAHLRFGWLTYGKRTEKTTTNLKLRLDRFIGEVLPDPPRQCQAHLVSIVGGDTQIAAIAAAISLGDGFTVEGPGSPPVRACLGKNAQCYRGSVQPSGGRKPLRHLIAVSEELAATSVAGSRSRSILACSSAEFIWASLAHRYGLPGIPLWATWFHSQLEQRKRITLLLGIGCDPVLVNGSKHEYLAWLGLGVRSGALKFPAENAPIVWPSQPLDRLLLPSGN